MDRKYEKLLPTEPPEALWEYEPMRKALEVHALVFKQGWFYSPLEGRNEKAAEVHCTACRSTFYTDFIASGCHNGAGYGIVHPETNEAIESGRTTTCPCCGTPTKLLHTTQFGGNARLVFGRYWPMTFHKIEGHFAILTWYVERWTDKNGATGRWTHPYEAYVCEGKKVIKLVGYQKSYCCTQQFNRWVQRSRCDDTYRTTSGEVVLPLTEAVLAGTEMENAKLELLLREEETFPISYMQVYLKHRNVENLLMQGMCGLVNEMLKRCVAHSNYQGGYGIKKDLFGIDWKKQRPCELLRMNKREFEFFKEQGFDGCDLEKWAFLKEKKATIRIEDLAELKRYSQVAVEIMLELDEDPMRVYRYLQRQEKKYPQDSVSVSELRDYRNMVRALGLEEDPYPQRLKRAHDQAVEEQNRRKDELKTAGVAKRFKELSRYAFEWEGLLIRPAKTAGEFRKEGKELCHCVQSYTDRHASGQTAIFFIRKVSAPEVPFYTLEYDEKHGVVVQNRGKHNCARTAEVLAFEAAWLEFIKTMKKKEKKGHGKQERNAAGSAA